MTGACEQFTSMNGLSGLLALSGVTREWSNCRSGTQRSSAN